MSIPQPWSGDQLYRPRPDWGGGGWSQRDYWVQPPNVIPPAPPFENWVPPAEQFAFGELPRDPTRYAIPPPSVSAQLQPAPPPPPPPADTAPLHLARPPWSLRDYAANQDYFSALNTPLLPPLIGSSLVYARDMQTWASWTLRDYSSFQSYFASFEGIVHGAIVPSPELFAFGELPRDMTALNLAAVVKRTFPGAPAARPVPQIRIAEYAIRPYDLTAQYLVLTTSVAQAGIPKVPIGGEFLSFDLAPIDLTPYLLVLTPQVIPAAPGVQIPPAAIPFIEWPGWQPLSYQQIQDQFSALATPVIPFFPPGLVPQFTPEALIRDVSHPTSLYTVQNFILPPPPPFVFPTPPTFIEWRQWSFAEYPFYCDQFSAWVTAVPPIPPFLVQAVTAGFYNGFYLYPGDVFLLNQASDFSDSSIDYSRGNAATPQYGWMRKVPAGTAVFYTETTMAPPNFPVIDPVPPKRFVY